MSDLQSFEGWINACIFRMQIDAERHLHQGLVHVLRKSQQIWLKAEVTIWVPSQPGVSTPLCQVRNIFSDLHISWRGHEGPMKEEMFMYFLNPERTGTGDEPHNSVDLPESVSLHDQV